jgi:hypothetical protein
MTTAAAPLTFDKALLDNFDAVQKMTEQGLSSVKDLR